jgi:hypothetical protein
MGNNSSMQMVCANIYFLLCYQTAKDLQCRQEKACKYKAQQIHLSLRITSIGFEFARTKALLHS